MDVVSYEFESASQLIEDLWLIHLL